jgi:hypothetical protein
MRIKAEVEVCKKLRWRDGELGKERWVILKDQLLGSG